MFESEHNCSTHTIYRSKDKKKVALIRNAGGEVLYEGTNVIDAYLAYNRDINYEYPPVVEEE